MSALEFVVGRQPVFDAGGNVFGYELLFCDTSSGTIPGAEEQVLSPQGVLTLVDVGIDRLVGPHDLYCRIERDVLMGDVVQVLPSDATVIIADPANAQDPEALERYRALLRDGYRIAVDQRGFTPEAGALLELATVLRIDIREVGPTWIADALAYCHGRSMQAIAANVDLRQELEECRRLGFDLFQGFLLSKPQFVPGRKLEPGRVAKLRLSTALLDEETDIRELEKIIRVDPAMAKQLLHLAGTGAAGGLRRTVNSLREALVLAGWRRLQSWVALLLLAGKGETSEEEIATCLVRARMCELVARRAAPQLADSAYTAGMLSSFDLLLRVPLEDALAALPIDDELRENVLERTGVVGEILADVIDFQLGNWGDAQRCGVDPVNLQQALVEALMWSVEANRLLSDQAPAPAGEAAPSAATAPGGPA